MYGGRRDSNESKSRLSENKISIYEERDKNNTFWQYILSNFGLATGYGSIWRLPFLIFKNGGGVFLIPYFIIFATVAIPIFYFETMIGQVFI